MLDMVVPKVIISRFKVDDKLTLGSTVNNPMVLHVNSLVTFDLDFVIGKAICGRVVDLYGRRRLYVPKLLKGDSN